MSRDFEESRVNRQKLFVQALLGRYYEEFRVVSFKKSLPPNPAATRVMEELVLPAQQWLSQRNFSDLRTILSWEIARDNEGEEPIYFLQVLYEKASVQAQDILNQFADLLRRNPYPINSDDSQDLKDRELLKEIHTFFTRISVY